MGREDANAHAYVAQLSSAAVAAIPEAVRPTLPACGAPVRPLCLCDACHEYGHLRNMCPKLYGPAGRSHEYPFHVERVKELWFSTSGGNEDTKELESVGANEDGL